MAPCSRFLLLLQLLGCMSASLACFCNRYPWSAWSACTRTCNHGVQQRHRVFTYDDYFWKSSCQQLCVHQDQRGCNEQACPINCLLTDFGPWSDCSSCAKKQFRTRSVLQPSQFGGSDCSVELTEERDCYPSKECKMPPIDCGDNFKCDNGRCINSTLACNKQNDCGDNSDERGCDSFTIVCPADKRVAPGADLVGNGFDALAEEPRGAVLDNMFMGGSCNLKRPQSTLLYHRIPHNFESFEIKVGQVEDFGIEPEELHTESIILSSSYASPQTYSNDRNSFWFPIFYANFKYRTQVSSNNNAFEASKKKDSKFIRVHQVLPVSTFKVRNSEDLVLSLPFLQFLQDLPLEYNYALYRDIFQRFGTHYYSSGKLGGHYDLLYQYSREELTSSGVSEEHFSSCLGKETFWTCIFYTEYSNVQRCSNNKVTEKYQGSFIQAAEKSFSMVKGGRAREAAALAWERQGAAPNKEAFKNWAKSALDNPAVVDYKLLPIIGLVRGIPCAATKRRHLTKALVQYLEEFQTCKCSPCPNNGRPVLSGTECKCVCQTGTFGTNCEKRAQDYTSEKVDGYWSCWGPWSHCGAAMKRYRKRRCDNPAPMKDGAPCQGPDKQEDSCHISIFQTQETCDNDDDFVEGWIDKLPDGVQGCLRPKSPENSFLRKAKQYYNFGEEEEFRCFTGFELDGFQYITCRPDGTWTDPSGKCLRKICLPPDIPVDMMLYPSSPEYKVGQSVGLFCNEAGMRPFPQDSFECGESLTWEPEIPSNLRCTSEELFVPEAKCGPGQKLQGSDCVCIQRESCISQPESICVLNLDLGMTVPMSTCSFLAGRCHGDPLSYLKDGSCDKVDLAKVEWAKYRAQMSPRSSVQEPCGVDTCYEWEMCTTNKKCQCRVARDCPKLDTHMFCVNLTKTQTTRNLNLCSLAALKCSHYGLEVVNEGVCVS